MKLNRILSAVIVPVLLLTINVAVFAAHPFTDVSGDSWYNEAVDYVYENKLMSGTGSDTFGPDTYMTRAMLVTVLYRLAGSPEVSGDIPFEDVAEDAYYYMPVKWCYENGIAAGTSASTFSPDANISREQMVTIFARYAEHKELDTTEAADLSGYADCKDISDYAVNAFAWAVNAGIVSGTSETTLSPQGTATRAQCAVIMQRVVEWTERVSDVQPTALPSDAPTIEPTEIPVVTPLVTPNIEPNPEPTVTPNPDDFISGETPED